MSVSMMPEDELPNHTAGAPSRDSAGAVLFHLIVVGSVGAVLLVAVGAVLLTAMGKDVGEETRGWLALAGAVLVMFALPIALVAKFDIRITRALRVVALLQLLVVVALVSAMPTSVGRSLNEHGFWPASLWGASYPALDNAVLALGETLTSEDPGASSVEAASVDGETSSDRDGTPTTDEPAGTAMVPTEPTEPVDRPLTPREVFERAAPGTVHIATRTTLELDEIFGKLVDVLGLDADEMTSTGSGFVVGPWLVVTNYHVIGDATSAKIVFQSGESYDVVERLVVDPDNDLTLVRVVPPSQGGAAATPPPLLELFAGDELELGLPTVAIGNPVGLDFSLTTGIVSAARTRERTTMIQMQTAIGPGSSGGPLLDDRARVIGVNTATHGAGLNLAVHVRHVRELLERAHAPQRLERWRPSFELADLESSAPLLPTARERVRRVGDLLVNVLYACTKPDDTRDAVVWPSPEAEVVLTMADEILADARVETNLGAPVLECLQKRVSLASATLHMMLAQGAEPPDRIDLLYERGVERGTERLRLVVHKPRASGDASTAVVGDERSQ